MTTRRHFWFRRRKINPRGYEVVFNAGVIQFQIAQRTDAVEAKKQLLDEAALFFGQAALLNPQSADAFRNRGIALAARARFTEARGPRLSYLNQAIDALERARN